MSLFPRSQQPRIHFSSQHSRPNAAHLPAYYKKLNVLCTCREAHQLPVEMKFIGFSATHKGSPMAVYACPYHGCDWREGYVRDFQTGEPRCLWGKNHHNNQ